MVSIIAFTLVLCYLLPLVLMHVFIYLSTKNEFFGTFIKSTDDKNVMFIISVIPVLSFMAIIIYMTIMTIVFIKVFILNSELMLKYKSFIFKE